MAELTEALNEIEKLLPSKTHIKDQIKNSEPKTLALVIKSYNLLPNNASSAHSIIDIILDKTWEDLNTGHWSSVPTFRRYIYSVASLMMVLAKIKLSLKLTNQERICKLSEALKVADHGLLLGGELRNELTKTAEILTLQLSKCSSKKIFDNILEPLSSLPEFCGVRGDSIPVLSCPSLETFYSDYFKPRKPAVLKDCINHWPALSKWKDINYLLSKAGERTVPVELGSKYDDSEWSQKLMNFQQFVEQHILVTKNKNEKGYLAQHQLFLQIPELKEDIREPEFCCCSDLKETDLNEENEDVDINAWFGPAGTVSPLHFDPKHNLLTQIVGRKRVILYDPKYSDRLSPYESKLLHNTAQVDPESPDYNKFSGYKDTPALETILNPGEMLYIPPTWWHHVRSFDISFSVSFWW